MKKYLKQLLSCLLLLLLCAGCGAEKGTETSSAAAASDIAESAELSAQTQTEESGAHQLTITALPVGKADALLLQADGHAAMIDTGEQSDAAEILQALSQRGITELDLLIITHFDKDHVGSAAAIVEAVPVSCVRYPDYVGTRDEYDAFMESIADHPNASPVTAVTKLTLGTAELTIYPAEDPEELLQRDGEQDNDLSLVTRLQYGSCSFLFCGDIEKARIDQMLETDTDWSCDWIKMPHHGVYQKALKDLLEAAQPAYAVITASEEDPAEEKTLKALEKAAAEVYDTTAGTVITTCDGETIEIQTES